MEDTRTRNWALLLYPDDDTHVNAMHTLASCGFRYCAILHDRDTYSEDVTDLDGTVHLAGDFKKPHWHVCLFFENARWGDSLASELGIKRNYLQSISSRDGALLYLLHASQADADKAQYELNEVFGTCVPMLAKLIRADDENERVLNILALLDSIDKVLTFRELLYIICENGLYGEFRRLGYGVKWLLEEHNASIADY